MFALAGETRMTPYTLRLDITPRFFDVDAYGHVNNSVFLTYFEEARVAYCRRLNIFIPGDSDIGFVVARMEIAFKRPIGPEDAVQVQAKTENWTERTFDFVYRIVDRRSGRVFSTGRSRCAGWDIRTGRPAALPPEAVERMRRFEQEGSAAGE